MSILHQAVIDSQYNTVKSLLNGFWGVDSLSNSKKTPLCYACEGLDVKMVDILLDYGANVNFLTSEKANPLFYTTMRGVTQDSSFNRKKIISIFINRKVNIEIVDICGDTLLHKIVKLGCWSDNGIFSYLIHNYNFDINKKGSRGLTCLHHAAINLSFTLVKTLWITGAELFVKDSNKLYPYDYAMDNVLKYEYAQREWPNEVNKKKFMIACKIYQILKYQDDSFIKF